MAELEATYQDSSIRVGDEVDFFASQLDRFDNNFEGSAAEQRAQVYTLVESYYTYMRNRANRIQGRQSTAWQRGGSADMDMDDADDATADTDPEELRRVEEEAQTWDLLRRVLPLRYRDQAASPSDDVQKLPTTSRRRWWKEFVLADSSAREKKVVLEWLQSSASHGPPVDEVVSELQQNAERGDILAHGWLHTRHKIKLQKSVNGYQGVLDPNDLGAAQSHLGSSTLVTQLDPDAITRQNRKVEAQDEFFERAIWLGCFEMLRRGYTMAEIREWCAVRTELWRAATIAPLPLANPEDEELSSFDPAALVLWRQMCFASAREGGTSEYDRAVYGLLAGDLESVTRISKSWDDYLFAHYNSMLRSQFDSFLVKNSGMDEQAARRFPVFSAGVNQSDPTTVSKRLISSLETNEATKDEAMRTLKVLQGAIIARDLDQHMHNQGLMLSRFANQRQKSKLIPESPASRQLEPLNENKYFDLTDHDSLRVLAHVLIVVNTLDRISGFSQDQSSLAGLHLVPEHIIAAYVSYLRLANLEEMIPLYCSKLSSPRLYEALSRNLIHVVGEDARIRQLQIIKTLGLDLATFATRQPELYFSDVNEKSVACEAKTQFKILEKGAPTLKFGRIVKPDFFGEDAEYIDPEDELIIRSLEWLLLVDGLFVTTCSYVLRAYKYFLKRTRLRAARALSVRIAGRDIVRKKTPVPIRADDEETGPNWLKEFTGHELPDEFLEECDKSKEELVTLVANMWELESLVRALDSMETLSSLAGLTREYVNNLSPSGDLANNQRRESNTSREMWQHTGVEVRKAKVFMEPVLKGWLLASNEGASLPLILSRAILSANQPTPTVDADFSALREAYIPETVLAYISCLHFAGTSLSRDSLLECMELSAVVAEKDSDVCYEFKKAGRLKELFESFTSCSKALAIWNSDAKKGHHNTNSKKMRELGWSRELWSIKS